MNRIYDYYVEEMDLFGSLPSVAARSVIRYRSSSSRQQNNSSFVWSLAETGRLQSWVELWQVSDARAAIRLGIQSLSRNL